MFRIKYRPSKVVQAITIFLLGALIALAGVFVAKTLVADSKPSPNQVLCTDVIQLNQDLISNPSRAAGLDIYVLDYAALKDSNSQYFLLIISASEQINQSKATTAKAKIEGSSSWKELTNLCRTNYPNIKVKA